MERIERIGPRLIMITSRFGERDFQRFCSVHHWASREGLDPNTLAECPECQVDLDWIHGRTRYEVLDARLLKEQTDGDTRAADLVGASDVLDGGGCGVRP